MDIMEIETSIAMKRLGCAVDYAVNELGLGADGFMEDFVSSGIAGEFEAGNPAYLAGCSGIELARAVLRRAGTEELPKSTRFCHRDTPEFWAGWALAWYQRRRGEPFADIIRDVPLSEIASMFHPVHEAPLQKFEEVMDARR